MIESEVPFGKTLYGWLHRQHLCIEQVVKHDQIEERYLAWETVRRQTNPYFFRGTGFEGYLVGLCETPDTALEAILTIGQDILDSIARLYRFEYNFKARLMKTLMRELDDTSTIHIWSAYLGAELGKLRHQVSNSLAAQVFQKRTYQVVRTLPPMIYHESQHDVMQMYVVGPADGRYRHKIDISMYMLNSQQQDAWLVVKQIGAFGHPLVRQILDRP